jgi:hypothetical protein
MELQILHKEINSKKNNLNQISQDLKMQFIGLDGIIDEMISLISPWYFFPQAQLRPLVINLWGMTESGKTALIQALIQALDYGKLFAQVDMGEFESDSAAWFKNTLTEELEFFHEQASIIYLDEFQFARTIDANSNEIGKDKLRVIWELIDSGRINYIPSSNSFYLKRADACLMNLLRAKDADVEIQNGKVIRNEKQFLDIFKGFYFASQDRSEADLNQDYFLSNDFVNGLYYLHSDDETIKEIIKEKLAKADLEGIIRAVLDGMKTCTALKELDLSKAIIFISGNLDEAFGMSRSMNPDINADDLHQSTLKINLTNIKSALKKRFRLEQIARLGNNHIIYRSFKSEHFKELIRRELARVSAYMKELMNFEIKFDDSVHDLIYREGVFPAQGTRPVLTTIKYYIESWASKISVEIIDKHLDVASVEWTYAEDEYEFIFKDAQYNIIHIYEEVVQLKIEALRKTTNKSVQAHTAIHEAGHAVLAVVTLRILPSLIISKSASDDCEGFCMVNFPEELMTKSILKKDIIISLGGYIAEKLIFGDEHTSSGVSSDIEHATSLANKAIKDYAMGSDPIAIAVYASESNDMFYIDDKHKAEALQLIHECENEAHNILKQNKLLLLKMAAYLTHHAKMDAEVLEQFARQYANDETVRNGVFKSKEDYFDFDKMIEQQLAEMERIEVNAHYLN